MSRFVTYTHLHFIAVLPGGKGMSSQVPLSAKHPIMCWECQGGLGGVGDCLGPVKGPGAGGEGGSFPGSAGSGRLGGGG